MELLVGELEAVAEYLKFKRYFHEFIKEIKLLINL